MLFIFKWVTFVLLDFKKVWSAPTSCQALIPRTAPFKVLILHYIRWLRSLRLGSDNGHPNFQLWMNSRLGLIQKQQEDAMHWYHLRNATQVSPSHLSPPHHKREVRLKGTCSKRLKYNEPMSSRYVNSNISVG